MKDNSKPLVSIRCLVYNHEPYLRQCLDGFVMQQTDFAFEAIVHDDASTDNSAAIIREYAEKYPDIIKPIYETENQYSKKDGSLSRIMNEAVHPAAKYIAFCEGDDYWINPKKLQNQVGFLEQHSDYSMCWTDAFVETGGVLTAYNRYSESCQSPLEDIIIGGGDFVPTCSIVMRKALFFAMPQKAKNYYVGDYPIQMWCGYMGNVAYIREQTCVYRFLAPGSWTSRHTKETKEQILQHFRNEKTLLDGYNELFDFKYNDAFEKRAAYILYYLLISAGEYEMAKPYLKLRKKYGMPFNKADEFRIYGFKNLARAVSFCIRLKSYVTRLVKK